MSFFAKLRLALYAFCNAEEVALILEVDASNMAEFWDELAAESRR